MEDTVQGFITRSLAPSTHNTYKNGILQFKKFCTIFGLSSPYPLTEPILCSFASYLGTIHLSPQTIKTYLAAIKFEHISLGFRDPYKSIPSATLRLVQRGIARQHALTDIPKHIRLPITADILRRIKTLWAPNQTDFNTIMKWAALCTAFFGFFRLGEITAPSPNNYNPRVHLSYEDISVDRQDNPRLITLRIKKSKTDQFCAGSEVSLARTDQDICPVAAMLSYLAVRRDQPGPLFLFEDGRFLTQHSLISSMRLALSSLGLDPNTYSGHSLRIGAATSAAARGVQDSTIKTLGRWKSNAYQRYIRLTNHELASAASSLASNK